MGIREKEGFSGWTNVVILFFCYFLLYGIVFYGFSVMFPAMIKAMKWARGDASIAQTVRGLMVGFAAPLVAIMINYWGTKKTILAGGALVIVGLVLLGTMTDQLWTWILFWGIFCGIGLSASGLVPIQTNLTYWFNKNRGITIGVVTAGASLGGVVAQPFFTWIIRENGSWQAGWLTAAAIAFVGMIGILWLKNKPADYGQHQDGISPEMATQSAAAGRKGVRTYRTTQSWTLKEARHTPALWHLLMMYTVTMLTIYMMMSHGILHLTDLGYTRMQAAYTLSFIALGGGIARVPTGWLVDRIEPRWVLVIMNLCYVLATVGLWQATSMPVLIAAAFGSGFCCAAGMVGVPTMIGNYFSPPTFAKVMGFMFPFQIGAGALIPVLAGYNHDFVKNYDLSFIVLIIFCFLAALSAFLAIPPSRATASVE